MTLGQSAEAYFDKMIEEGTFETSVKVIQECGTLSHVVEKGIELDRKAVK